MKKKYFFRKALSSLLVLIMLVTVMPLSAIPVSASTNTYTYNAEAAVAFAESHCSSEKQLAKNVCSEDWLCAEFVANCLKAGGFTISGYTATVNAKAQGEYMQQYESKMTGRITGKAIHDYDFVLPLKKGDIVYIVYDDTVSASGHVLLYSGEKDSDGNYLFYAHNSRKIKETYTLTGEYLEAATEMYAIILNNNVVTETNTIIDAQEQAVQWAKEQASKPKDYDGAYGVQCVDLAVAYYKYLGEKSPGGNGCDYATNKLPSGWTRIKNSNGFVPQPGDIAVWTKTGSIYGHVAIVLYADLSTLTVSEFLGSNGTARTHTYSYSYGTFYGVIRPSFSKIQTPTSNSTNPGNYPICERDLVYNSTVETGDDVKWVQCVLKHLGYSIDIDGSYGPSSRDTIKKFQSAYGLTVDGVCGENTRAKLKEVWASKGHTWDSGTIVTAATHTSTGVKNHKCNYCEATKNETIAKLSGHTYSTWQNYSTTQHKKICACGDIQYADHTWNSGTITTQATCTVNGVKTYTCTGCSATKTESISATGHSYSSWQNHSATQHKKTCACGDIQYADHTWNSGTITTQATCTVNGVKTYTCTGCNATKTEAISAKGHSYGAWQNYNSTQHKRSCSCGAYETANHSWNAGTVTKAATHTEQGIKTYTCTVCSGTKTEAIAKISEHTYGAWQNHNSSQHKKICACGEAQYGNHTWNDGTVTKVATHTEQGVKTYTCTECSATKTESIPVITIHTYGAWEKYNETQHKRICACGEFELLNHDWDSGKITTPATNTTEGVKTYTCSTCNATKTEKTPVLVTNHEWDNGVITYAPLCTGEGIKTYTCVKCGETKEVTIIFTGHTYGAWESCSDTQHKRICACGEKEEIADHAWNNSLVTKEPTYTEYGIITYYCNTCGTSKTENIPMLEVPENAPHIIVDSKDALIGSTVTVIIQLKDNTGITSMRINVAYDSSLLTLTNVEYNNAMGGQSVLPENIETLNGNVVLYWTDGFADYEGNDTFVTLTFVVSDAAVVNETTTIAVTYDAEDIYDVEESNVAFICEDGIITFIDYTPGDISGDGVLNSKDTTRLMRYLAGWDVEVNEAALDVNGDGVVNTKDTTRLMRYLAGWDVEIC